MTDSAADGNNRTLSPESIMMDGRSGPVGSEQPSDRKDFHEVKHLLRRAEQEVVAAIGDDDPRVRASHDGLANRRGRASRALIADLDAEIESG